MAEGLAPVTDKKVTSGKNEPLGATLTPGGVNFAIYSEHAGAVFLLLFETPRGAATDIIELERGKDNVWHAHVGGIGSGQYYGYKVDGEYDPGNGLRFNPHKLLVDPYARALSGDIRDISNLMYAYDVMSPEKDLAMDTRDNSRVVPKAIVVDDRFNWEGDRPPGIPMKDLIIYEAHVKGFTAHPSSNAEHPGTYTAFIEKIPYLKDLGINAVELMPVQEYFVRKELLEKGLSDFWGYNTIAFFAPEISYSTGRHPGCQVGEFKNMVKALHKAGIEVILDVVYNHTGEGNELGPTLSFKGIDNRTYYSLLPDPDDGDRKYRYYLNDTSCGNTLNIANPAVLRLVLDSLRYWVEVMHVDGFRFDLASILARVNGEFEENSPFFEAVAVDPVLNRVKMIAEPWDSKGYEVGNFPRGWSEWNGEFRKTARRFLKGDEGLSGEMSRRMAGSPDIYREDGRHPYNSINYITCHDGFTLYDLYSYNEKHNEANLEDNRDGADENNSWNCGAEGPTEDRSILRLREQMMKNAFCCLLFSAGTPMLLYGDEVMRTQKGNNNAYCQDNELFWFNWDLVGKNADMLDFVKKAIALRKKYSMFRRSKFFTEEHGEDGTPPDIIWYGNPPDGHGGGSRKKSIYFMLQPDKDTPQPCEHCLFMAFNMGHRARCVDLPDHGGLKWYRMADTSLEPGKDLTGGENVQPVDMDKKYRCRPRSVNILADKR
jgi:glycogen operon protein